LSDYFTGVRDFILREDGQPLTELLAERWGQGVSLSETDHINIRYEKYGTLYQIASVDVIAGDKRAKFAVSTALSFSARETLEDEFRLISDLNRQTGLPYLPRVYWLHTMTVGTDGRFETVKMSLSEWFDDFHEWHFTKEADGRQHLVIWDMGRGNRYATELETREIITQASKILTMYFDVNTFCRIIPWHHGAGDFIVRTDGQKVEVRLITVRGYEAISNPGDEDRRDPLQPLLLFLLESMTRMRLDKQEGMGETIWAEGGVVRAALDGFCQALRTKEARGECPGGTVDRFVDRLRALSLGRIKELIRFQLGEYLVRNSSDHQAVKNHLGEQAEDICRAVQHLFC
jgi:hypothetical protein